MKHVKFYDLVLNFCRSNPYLFIKRFFLFIIFLAVFLLPQEIYGQEKTYTIDLQNVKIKDVFKVIEGQSAYRFFYNTELNEINKVITISVKDASIEDVLNKLFSSTDLSFTVLKSNNQIVIAPKGTTGKQHTVKGSVSDNVTSEPLIGVNVVVEGTAKGTNTDINGEFTLEVPGDNTNLNISYVGYISEMISVGTQTSVVIKLNPEVKKLDEVVVVGYGTQKKTSITGSFATVKGSQVSESPVANISNSIAGRVSGISMRPKGGQPGQDNPDIHIRGIATTGNNAPLIVVDGIIRNNINQIDPSTIESVTVLKDAAAVAPYGMGGANGVILITTKSGKSGETTLNFSYYFGIQTPTVYPKMLNAKDYMTLSDSAANSNSNQYLIANYDRLHAQDPDKYPNSNFYNDVSNLSVPIQNYNMQLIGGNEKIKYFAGLGYFQQDGMFENLGYTHYNFNLKLETQATTTTKVYASVLGSIEKIKSTSDDALWILWNSVKFIPTDPMVYSNGLWGASQGFSPEGSIKAGYNNCRANTLMSSISIEQQLPFIKGLSIRGTFSYDPTDSTTKNWSIPTTYYQFDTSLAPANRVFSKNTGSTATTLTETLKQSANYTYQAYLNYANTFGKHEITVLGVAEARQSTVSSFFASNEFPIIRVDELSLGGSNTAKFGVGGGSSTGSQVGYVYRVGYNYSNKYFIEAAGRYDGHYTFAPGKRYGYFPSYSAAWRVSEESFLKDRFAWLYNLKIRASWGKSGNLPYINGQLAEFQYLNGYTLYPNRGKTFPAYVFGNTPVSGSYIPQESNPGITWETSTKTNVGFDLGLWKGLVNFEVDYFHEDRNNMLIPPSTTVPIEYGITLALDNSGVMTNNGVEVSLNSSYKFQNGIEVGLAANYSYAKNKVIKSTYDPTGQSTPPELLAGKPFGTQFGYHSLGYFSPAEDIAEIDPKNRKHKISVPDDMIDTCDGYYVKQFGILRPGYIKYADLNHDNKIGVEDFTVIGNPTYPSTTYGFTPSIGWKGFDLSLFFQGAAGASISIANFQSQPFSNNKSNTGYEYYNNYWRRDRQNATYPRLDAPLSSNNTQVSDFWLRNSDYLRLKNLIFGYRVPAKILKYIGVKALRAYFSGQNLLTFSKVKFIDPEEASLPVFQGKYYYPLQKVYTFGVDVTF